MFKLWWFCAILDASFTFWWFNTHDAGFGAAILTVLSILFFRQWHQNIVAQKQFEEHLENIRLNNRAR